MTRIYVASPNGNLTLQNGAAAPPLLTSELVLVMARLYNYSAILSGSETGALLDETGTPLHPKQKVSAGEYTLLVTV